MNNIQSYAGEFTISPIPLEMSMNYCSHQCSYCFANLNQPDRKLDVNGTINQIKNSKKNKGLTNYLLGNGYPVLISNRVDPFAHSNWRQTLTFIELLQNNGNKIAWQTRGGQGVTEALDLLDHTCNFYLTINIFDDLIRQTVEPGAPSVSSKFDLIDKLMAKGHHVSVGINPIVEEWLPFEDFENLVKVLYDKGVRDFWLETLHLNGNQIKNMSKREKDAIGEEVLNEAKKRNSSSTYFMFCLEYMEQMEGVNIFSINQPKQSNYFESYKKNYDKIFPTHQGFINHCFETMPEGGEIKWHQYYEYMQLPFFKELYSEADGYFYRIARNVWKELEDTPIRSLERVLLEFWRNIDVSKSLYQNNLFTLLGWKDEKDQNQLYFCKENRQMIYYFDPKQETNGLKYEQ